MKLSEADWKTLSSLLEEGLDVAAEARPQWVEGLRGLDDRLKSVLLDLLEKHARGDTAGLPNTLPKFAGTGEAARLERPMPTAVGRYRVVGLIGEGGMGVVYEAVQELPRRTVALKVVKPGLTAPEVLRRFEHESESLARLQHPGIAQIYEAGIADTGFGPQPWFAMELIRGLPLGEFAAARQLHARQRVEIVIKTCDAVHHAHLRGIIHRDLKPANILVDDAGQPKIVDFGVARIADDDNGETHFGDLVGTLAYMSPEQVLADPLEIDARTDVYALGVLLYELLAGRLPYQVGGRLPQAMRAIREENPAALGTVNASFRGDLEIIAAKALAKEKTERYGSAADLAADLRRYLSDDPILARPPSAIYQLRKFAARHKGLVGAVMAVFVALVAGLVATGWQTARANKERDRAVAAERSAIENRDRAAEAERVARGERLLAQRERDRAVEAARRADTQSATAKAVSDFLQNDLLALAGPRGQLNPKARFDPDLKVRTVLDRAAARIAGKFDSQPAVEASIRQTIGSAYGDVGVPAEAETHLERAVELRRRVLGRDHPDTLISMNDLGRLYSVQSKFGPAEALLTETMESRRRLHGAGHPSTLAALAELATLAMRIQGDYPQGEAMIARLLEKYRALRGEEHPDTLTLTHNVASVLVNQGKYSRAEELYRKTWEIKGRVLGPEHPSTLNSLSNLGVASRFQGKYEQAETLLESALAVRRRAMGNEHPETLTSLRSLALLYQAEGKNEQAAPMLAEVLAAFRKALGESHQDTIATTNNLAESYRRLSRYAEAESLFNDVLARRRRVLPAGHPNLSNVLVSLGGMKLDQGKFTEAEALLREALDGQRKSAPESWRRYYTESLLGSCLVGLGRYTEAEPMLTSGYKGVLAHQNTMPFENRDLVEKAKESIGRMYQAQGKPAPAID